MLLKRYLLLVRVITEALVEWDGVVRNANSFFIFAGGATVSRVLEALSLSLKILLLLQNLDSYLSLALAQALS